MEVWRGARHATDRFALVLEPEDSRFAIEYGMEDTYFDRQNNED